MWVCVVLRRHISISLIHAAHKWIRKNDNIINLNLSVRFSWNFTITKRCRFTSSSSPSTTAMLLTLFKTDHLDSASVRHISSKLSNFSVSFGCLMCLLQTRDQYSRREREMQTKNTSIHLFIRLLTVIIIMNVTRTRTDLKCGVCGIHRNNQIFLVVGRNISSWLWQIV